MAAERTIVKVVMTEHKFTPDHLEFRNGTRYRLHLENAGSELHEFTISIEDFWVFDRARFEERWRRTDVVLQPHESKEVIFVPHQKGSYTLVCADHDWTGMVGHITVK